MTPLGDSWGTAGFGTFQPASHGVCCSVVTQALWHQCTSSSQSDLPSERAVPRQACACTSNHWGPNLISHLNLLSLGSRWAASWVEWDLNGFSTCCPVSSQSAQIQLIYSTPQEDNWSTSKENPWMLGVRSNWSCISASWKHWADSTVKKYSEFGLRHFDLKNTLYLKVYCVEFRMICYLLYC